MVAFGRWAGLLCLLVVFGGCGGDKVSLTSTPDQGTATVVVPMQERRIAIVHSETSKLNYYSAFAYNQLFAAMQSQAMMAGFPFDLLSEEELTTTTNLADYDVLVLPAFSHVDSQNRDAISAALIAAQNGGVTILTSGEFMAYDQTGERYTDADALIAQLLGIAVQSFLDGAAANVTIATIDHPVTSAYTLDEELVSYTQLWTGIFNPIGDATTLTTITSDGQTYPGAQIINRETSVIHFANEQVMADNNLLWSTLRWAVYKNEAPVSLQVSRNDSVFVARNDMDLAMVAGSLNQTEVPLLDIITDWKQKYNFVGSYYIDIGNDLMNGEFTNWTVSAPLYRDYIALGSEIGTHSWTHPHNTALLTAAELEFEFNQSKNEISTQVGEPVIGGAVPGTDESLMVVEELNKWFSYFSGRTGKVGNGYPNAFGFLEPQHDMLYFSLNMSPDYELIDVDNNTPEQAGNIWQSEMDTVLKRAQTPIVHWLWHDYGPTTQTTNGFYSKEMFENTLAYASAQGSEFTTTANMHDRMRAFQGTSLSVGAGQTVRATIDSNGVGQFALEVADNQLIEGVKNWYAYNDKQVFIADDGGTYDISLGSTQDQVTRISALPMRARLLQVSGDSVALDFSFEGEGEVEVTLHPGMVGNFVVSGASSFTPDQNKLTLKFAEFGEHTVSIAPVTAVNRPPVADAIEQQGETIQALDIQLNGSDPDNDVLQYEIVVAPQRGTLSGSAPQLQYTSDIGFSGLDSFSFVVSDGTLVSDPATVALEIALPRPANSAPVANRQVLETTVSQPLSFVLSGADREQQPLSYQVSVDPANGALSGVAPDLVYAPVSDYTGIDEMRFIVSDGVKESESQSIFFNVNPQPATAGGTLSNPVSSIVVDGELSEWIPQGSLGTDPQDITGARNDIDWAEARMGHDQQDFYIAYTLHAATALTWGHTIYLDTDTDSSTGFHGFAGDYPLGADFAIEGNSLIRYTSQVQNEWSWEYLQQLPAQSVGVDVELKLPRALIGNPDNVFLLFVGQNAATGGDAFDLFPDAATNPQALPRLRKFSYSVNPNSNVLNITPVANSQELNMVNSASMEILLTGNDVNGDLLSYSIVNPVRHGVIAGSAPALTYTPDNGYTGQDRLSFVVNDGELSSNSSDVIINVVDAPAVNSIPLANAQSLSTVAETPVVIVLAGIDADGSALSYALTSNPQNGVLSGTAPNLTYTANAGFTGMDEFKFTVSDGADVSAIATISIEVTAQQQVNTRPAADNKSLTTPFDTAVGITLSGSDADGQSLTYQLTDLPTQGEIQGTAPQLTYVPFAAAVGTDTFSYVTNDGLENSLPATVTIEIESAVVVNEPPVAIGQVLSTDFQSEISIVISGTDPEQAALTYAVVEQPTAGALTGTAPNLVYTPGVDFTGLDSIQFVVNDGQQNSELAVVTIDVGAAPGGPLSNPVTSMIVDGLLNDWAGVVSFPPDPDDATTPGNTLDWREFRVAHDDTQLYLAFRNDGPFQISWGHGIYIDIDGDRSTGFVGYADDFPLGADLLIEYDSVYSYNGTGTNWGWAAAGESIIAVNGDVGERSLPRNLLGNSPNLQFYLRANNAAVGGQVLDHYPDAALDAAAPAVDRYLSYTLAP